MFRTLALLLTSLLTVSMLAGCGDDDSNSEEALSANVIGVNPPSGSEIAVNGGIMLTFDNIPTDVAVSGYTVTVAGKTATIVGPFRRGPLVLAITWADGRIQTLTYTVTGPDCCGPIRVTGATVKDGDTDVDPELINIDGKIEINFTEEVSGNITLQTEGGDDVGWLGKVEGNKAILQLVKGREVTNEMIYVIVAKVSDALGNEVDIKITFVTKAKA